MRSRPSPDAPKRRPRRRFIRNEEERKMIDQIAGFFDERDKAFSLLKASINNGYIITPYKDMPIQEFLKVQQGDWKERQNSSIPHKIQFLRNSLSAGPQAPTNLYDFDSGENLDEIEGDRDRWLELLRSNGPSQFSEDD